MFFPADRADKSADKIADLELQLFQENDLLEFRRILSAPYLRIYLRDLREKKTTIIPAGNLHMSDS